MAARGAEPSASPQDWIIVVDYFRNAGEVIISRAPCSELVENPHRLAPSTPSVMLFNELAAFVSPSGARRLQQAANAVATSLRSTGARKDEPNPLTPEEVQILRKVVAGERVADIGLDLGFAERSVYRKLNRLWAKLQTRSRAEGMALVISRGWLD